MRRPQGGHGSRRALRRARFAWVMGVLALLALAVAGPAAAHAVLETSRPADGETLEQPPGQVVLTFNEPVNASLGGVRVFDSDGTRVDTGEVELDGTSVQAPLRAGLAEGTYITTWRVLSADSHSVNGAFVFSVGVAGSADSGLIRDLLAAEGQAGLGAAAAVLRFVLYATLLFAGGAVVFLIAVHHGPAAERRLLARMAAYAAAVGAAATLCGFAVQSAVVTGLGLSAAADGAVVAEVLGTSYGWSAVVRLAGCAGLILGAVLIGRRWGGPVAAVAAVAAVGSFVLEGHTAVTAPRWLSVTSDLVHLVAAGVWFGGLVCLAVVLRRRRLADDAVGGAQLVVRFSTVATASLAGVVVAGLGLAWLEVRALRALFSTTYGWTLVAKTAVAALVITGGAYNKRRLVPAIRAATPAVPAGGAPAGGAAAVGAVAAPPGSNAAAAAAAWSVLRRTVRLETAGLLVVLAITAVLVNLVPAKDAAGVTGPFDTLVALGDYQLQMTVDPNRAGFNEMHFYLLTELGAPAGDVEQITVELIQTGLDTNPIVREPDFAGPGHWVLPGPELAVPGPWVARVRAPVSRFEDATVEIGFLVNP